MNNLDKVTKLHKDIFTNTSPFGRMAVTAIVIGLGDLMCVIGDLVWLFGDMSIDIHPHHYIVLVILTAAMLVIVASFIWLYVGICRYLIKHNRIVHERKAKYLHKRREKKLRENEMKAAAKLHEGALEP
jgi:hypothetical protein